MSRHTHGNDRVLWRPPEGKRSRAKGVKIARQRCIAEALDDTPDIKEWWLEWVEPDSGATTQAVWNVITKDGRRLVYDTRLVEAFLDGTGSWWYLQRGKHTDGVPEE